MYTKELLIKELDTLPQSAINAVYQFVEFQKYLMNDTTYLCSIPGMKETIIEGMNTPREELIPIEELIPDWHKMDFEDVNDL